MPKDFDAMEDSNASRNPSIHDLLRVSRRQVLGGGVGVALASLFAPSLRAQGQPPLLGFKGIPPSVADRVVVPEGYVAEVLAAWGDPVGLASGSPAFRFDASNSAAEQEAQLGMHHDGMHYFPLDGSRHGLLAINHEYVDEGLLHTDGMATWTAGKVRKSQAAMGVGIIEVALKDGRWHVVRPSKWARRITVNTAMQFSGPAAGHPMLRTAFDPQGLRPVGTINNCASGLTPWGTYITSEENFIFYFRAPEQPNAHEARWGMRRGGGHRWHEHDERFDATKHPNEPNRFGWIVEIDPYDPTSTPVKRTALGRAAHEGGTVALTRSGRAVVYMGEDARFEYIYKFVSRDRVRPGGSRANATLLDHGTLYVARFDEAGRGEWLPLVHGLGLLTQENGLADQGEVLVKARQASDLLGGTKMDRPEWIAIDAERWVYCALTNNTRRGAENQLPADPANPRPGNAHGHVIRWREDGDFDGVRFQWDPFVLAGDPANEREEGRGNVKGDAFGCPDALWVDARGVLWIQTDMGSSVMGQGEFARLGNNAMLAADPRTGEVRRFLTGPVGCEVTGAMTTPDNRTMFVNIQHPGEPTNARTDPANPRQRSNWPDHREDGRPRSATVVIRKADGGPIGT